MTQRARLIYNPTAGNEGMTRYVAEILNVLESAGYEASAFQTTPEPFSAKKEASRATEDGFDLVVAAGGDGTINEVVNGIAPHQRRPKMAIIPAGTTNDYARALKIPREDPVAAAKVVASGKTLRMDIGQANDTYFMNIAAGGLLTELTYAVPSEFKSIFGYFAYVMKGAEMLPAVRRFPLHLEYDEGTYDGPASMFLLAMTNSIGGFEQIVPDSALGDGKFSLIVVKTANMADILVLMGKVLTGGRHVDDPNIIYTKTRVLKASRGDGDEMKINLDGEYGGSDPMTFTNLKQHIEMYANVDEIPAAAIGGAADHVKEVETIAHQDIDGDGKIGIK
ncbi:diacylglycerol kinase family lipid kinase [Lacticaseibacillus mingshuiensis]|uniref:Diacylglycerol kinase family lipid kinase n=1 Tax=Lacticaseibacillus mingshuiensis TaxID=2799574 RepID=A0ABW4CGP1_9LACO|nr:diacylglycerol kinase family lipid kinase [Lacticaseibacillus mingshuiensis]